MKNPFKEIQNEFTKLNVRGYGRPRWSEDQFLNNQEEQKIDPMMIPRLKINLLFILVTLCFLLLLIKVCWWQIGRGHELITKAENTKIVVTTILPIRGRIYSTKNQLLAEQKQYFRLEIIPAYLPKPQQQQENLIQNLISEINSLADTPSAAVANLNDLKLAKNNSNDYQPIVIADNISREQAIPLMVKSANWPGVSVKTYSLRNYYQSELFAHIIGYWGKISNVEWQNNKDYLPTEYIGKIGLEAYYEKQLRGEPGKKIIEVDSLGKERKILDQTPALSGDDLTLTIDQELQVRLTNALQTAINKTGQKGGAAIALNPNNGKVLALVSLPGYDNNQFVSNLSLADYRKITTDPNQPLFNRVIAGEYPSGSTIKPIIAAAGLQEKVITENFTVNSTGGIKIENWFFPDWKAGGHGITNVKKALAESVNTFFYYLGGGNNDDFTGLGVDRIDHYAGLFGLNQKSGIDLISEQQGFLPTKEWKLKIKNEPWYIGDTYHLAIGQGDLLVTPVQVANYTALFANNGTLYQPQIADFLTESTSGEKVAIAPKIIRADFIQPDYLDIVREGLRQTVTSGSAKSLQSLKVKVAAKTGTAQFGNDNQSHAWFTCFAPYNQPQIVLTVLIENGGEGSDSALSVAKEILEWYFR